MATPFRVNSRAVIDSVQKRDKGGESLSSEESSRNAGSGGCLDKVFLLGAALSVSVIGVASFVFAEIYHVNYTWVFCAWNSILLVPMVWGLPQFC